MNLVLFWSKFVVYLCVVAAIGNIIEYLELAEFNSIIESLVYGLCAFILSLPYKKEDE